MPSTYLSEIEADLLQLCQADGTLAQNPPARISVYRRDAPSPLESYLYEPVLCVVLQGSKKMRSGDIEVEVRSGDALVVSHHLPVLSQIIDATRQAPYLALVLTLDPVIIRDLVAQIGEFPVQRDSNRAISCNSYDAAWLEPLHRYLLMAEDRSALAVLGNSVLRELHYRLLTSPTGAILRNLNFQDSHASRIARAISLIRADLSTSLRVGDVAGKVGMSASAFHSHFKSMTGTTPLQYQKDLRLITSRDLLESGTYSVSSAAFTLGYESPTHFSRDYKRKFGHSPSTSKRQLVTRNANP